MTNTKNDEDKNEKSKVNPRWTNQQSLALINTYGDMKEDFDGSRSKKIVWDKLATTLDLGYDGPQCQGRWKTMLQGRKLAEDHNRTSGKDRKAYMFEKELAIVLGLKRNVNPSHLLESSDVVELSSTGGDAKKAKFSRAKLNGLPESDGELEDEIRKKV